MGNGNTRRTQRMASLIRSELARLLIEEVSDPRLREIVITEVELSPDLKNARVYFAIDASHLKEVSQGFQRAIPFFRKKLGDNLALRYVPELLFQVDEHGNSLTRLLHIFDEIEKSGDNYEQLRVLSTQLESLEGDLDTALERWFELSAIAETVT